MSVSALQRWLAVQALVWVPLLLVQAWLVATESFEADWLAYGALLLFASYVTLWFCLRPRGTPADYATLARFVALVAAVIWVGLAGRITWTIWTLWLVVVVSDLVDGWFARRFGGSEQGEVLDMETDQLTTLALASVVTVLAGAGVWTLLLPGLKYVFAIGMLVRGVDAHQPKPIDGDNVRGKRICALVMTLLLICALPVAPQPLRIVSSLTAVLLLSYSFSSDAVFLLRGARRPTKVA